MRELDDRVLVGNLVAGALWLVPLLFLTWPTAVVGGAYVVVSSVFLAAAYGRQPLSRRRELAAWIAPWASLVVLWGGVLALVGGDDPEAQGPSVGALVWLGTVAAVLATVSYLLWQGTALAVRLVLRWADARSEPVTD